MFSYKVEVKRFYIESKTQFTKKGNPVVIPVTIRKMFVTETNPILGSGLSRIVQLTRNGETTYSLSVIPAIPQSIWANPSGKTEPWFKLGKDYKRDGKPMNKVEFLHWLKVRFGLETAQKAFDALETAQPDNLKDAA